MSNKRITDLTELTNPTTDDVLPIVDIATNTTQKVQVGNLPTTTAVTNALATKQDTLVSGTNIKTLNSQSLLGNGNIVLTANPSGVAGAIQFSNGSAFASDASNLFWDDTNNRLGVGTNAPNDTLTVAGTTNLSQGTGNPTLLVRNNGNFGFNAVFSIGGGSNLLNLGGQGFIVQGYNSTFGGTTTDLGARVGIKGSGSTSATTSLLVQNSAGTQLMKIPDGGARIQFGLDIEAGTLFGQVYIPGKLFLGSSGSAVFGNDSLDASAVLQANSTTKGFLPPRMTTTQKNAIASPLAGLQVYDTTTNKLCCYNGSTWNDLF